MIIKTILVTLIIGLLGFFLQNRNTAKLKAGKKLLFVIFVIGSVVAVVHPDLLNDVAHWVGVGRGADLLLYALVVAFCFVTLNIYLSLKDYEEKFAILTREIGILNARLDASKKPRAGRKK